MEPPPSNFNRDRDDASRGRLGVSGDEAGRELIAEVGFVLEIAVLEERAFHPADEALDRALLVATSRRAHLDADADVDDGLRERGIPCLDLAPFASLRDDGLRPIEDGEER